MSGTHAQVEELGELHELERYGHVDDENDKERNENREYDVDEAHGLYESVPFLMSGTFCLREKKKKH